MQTFLCLNLLLLKFQVVYSVHVPTNGEYYLQIFASKMDATRPGQVSSIEGVKLKCVCKFKIIRNSKEEHMYALPNCAPGEWGPNKAARQFQMTAVSHQSGIITAENNLKVKFTLGMPLVFLAKLRMNGVDDKYFQDFIDAQFDDHHLRVKVGFPLSGQYGLDIYAKPKSAPADQPLAHACKYLVNVTDVQNPVDIGVAEIATALETCMGNWGALPEIQKYSVVPQTHTNWKIKTKLSQTVIKFQVPQDVVITAHLVKEPNEDHKDHLNIQRQGSDVVAITAHGIKSAGNYMVMVFSRMDSDDSTVYSNIFNYLIQKE